MNLETVLNSIDSNENLTKEIKENFKELVVILNRFFPMVDLTNLNERMKTLKVIKNNKLLTKDIIEYHPMSNELCFNLDEIMKNYDIRHVLMNAILRITTAHDQTFGFDQNNKLVALNIGYSEILTNFIVGNQSEKTLYDDEVIATNLISDIIGHDTLFQAYFTNNSNMLVKTLIDKGVE